MIIILIHTLNSCSKDEETIKPLTADISISASNSLIYWIDKNDLTQKLESVLIYNYGNALESEIEKKLTFSDDSTQVNATIDFKEEYQSIYNDPDVSNNLITIELDKHVWGWQEVGNPGFSDGIAIYNKIQFHNNEPYVAFKDWTNGYKLTMMKFNGINWENIGNPGFSNKIGTFLDFVFHNGEPYVAFDDSDNSRIPSIMKFNGTTWESLPSPSTNTAYDINLVSNGSDLYIGYKDFGAQFKATVKKFNGSSWDTVGSRGFTSNGIFSLDLEFNNHVPYVSYIENAGLDKNGLYVYKPSVMKFNGTTWELVGKGLFTEKTVEYTNLAFYQDKPCIAFRTSLSNNQKLSVMTFNDNEWVDISSSQDFTNDYASTPDLKVYNDKLYVLYVTGGLGNSFARLKRYNGTNWENLNGDLIFNSVVFNVNMNFSNNQVFVAMEDWSNSRKLTVQKHTLTK